MKNDFRARNHPAYWAFIVHRTSGLLLTFFLPLHFWALGQAFHGAAGLDRFEERHWRELERQLGMERPPDEPLPIQPFDADEATHSGGLAVSGNRNTGRRVIKSRWLTR